MVSGCWVRRCCRHALKAHPDSSLARRASRLGVGRMPHSRSRAFGEDVLPLGSRTQVGGSWAEEEVQAQSALEKTLNQKTVTTASVTWELCGIWVLFHTDGPFGSAP